MSGTEEEPGNAGPSHAEIQAGNDALGKLEAEGIDGLTDEDIEVLKVVVKEVSGRRAVIEILLEDAMHITSGKDSATRMLVQAIADANRLGISGREVFRQLEKQVGVSIDLEHN